MTAPEAALAINSISNERGPERPAYELTAPARQSAPVVFSSPHSGRHYPEDFVEQSVLDVVTLRASEDYYVDELFSAAPSRGMPLIQATHARAYVDVNREAWELDPNMFHEPLPDYVNHKSGRVAAGLGTVARVVASGTNIYGEKLPFADAMHRVNTIYKPYHEALNHLLDRTHEQFGCAVLIDCHSMPSAGTSFGDLPLRSRGASADIILGDRYGRSCSPAITLAAEQSLLRHGYNIVRNDPYSGGFNTREYGGPATARHALQIEINRGLYVDETTLERTEHFATLRAHLGELIDDLAAIDPHELKAAP